MRLLATVLLLLLAVSCSGTDTSDSGTQVDSPSMSHNMATSRPSNVTPKRSAVPDGINDRFLDPNLEAASWTERWEVESREIYTSRHAIVKAAGIQPGQAVADVGCGTGLFVGLFSEAVGANGSVKALDISPKFVDHVRQRVVAEGLDNVTPVLSGETSTELPPASVDLIYVCDTYHHFEYHEAMLKSLHDTLRPGGWLVIVDFERIPGVSRDWVLGHVRAGKEQVTGEIEAAGFRYVDEIDVAGLEENYLVRFRKP